MNLSLLFAVVLISLACFANAKKVDNKKPDKRPKAKLKKDRELEIEGNRIKIEGKSGRFCVTMKGQNECMSILMDAIQERDKNGSIVGKSGKKKHSLNTFAPIDFDFTATEKTLFKGAVNASYFTFSAEIPGTGATLTVNMYFFTVNGSSSLCDGNNFTIKSGSVKFDIMIENWTFCGDVADDCKKGEVGDSVDFKLTVQRKGAGKLGKKKKNKGKRGTGEKLFFNGQAIEFPNVYEKDGTCTNMTEGYPSITKRGEKYTVTFRFAKFSSKVYYDPTVDDGSDEAQYDTTTNIGETPTDAPTDGPTTSGGARSIIFPSFFSMILAGFVAIRF